MCAEFIFPDLNLNQSVPQTPTSKSSNTDPSETQVITAVLFSGATSSYPALPEGQRLDNSHCKTF